MKTTLATTLFLFATPTFAEVVRVAPDAEKAAGASEAETKETAKPNDAATPSAPAPTQAGVEKSEPEQTSPSVEAPPAESATEVAGEVSEAPEDASKGAKKKKKKANATSAEEDLSQPRIIFAPEAPPEPPIDPETRSFSHHLARFEFVLGGSLLWVDSSALDLFAKKDLFGRFDVRIARSFALGERLSFAISPEWNVTGAASDGARSNHSFLRMSEFSLGLELRYFLSTRFLGYFRVSPGGTHTQAELGNGTALLAHESFYFHGDLTAGLVTRLLGSANGEESGLRLHGYFEAGYDWMPSRTLTLSAKSGAPERTEPFEVSDLSLSAPHIGFGLVLSY